MLTNLRAGGEQLIEGAAEAEAACGTIFAKAAAGSKPRQEEIEMPRVSTTNELKQKLFDAYSGFADKRVQNLDKGSLFIIDDRRETDEDAAGKLFLWFCQMFADVVDKNTVKIIVRGDVPDGPLVAKWFAQNCAEKSNFGLEVVIKRGKQDRLSDLAAGFRAIVRPGARYDVKSYKYVCPRVANLRRRELWSTR